MPPSLSTEKPYPLDIRSFKETGDDLRQAIVDAVKATQATIIRALPDRLRMTIKQYNDLAGTPEMQQVYDQTGEKLQGFFLYKTVDKKGKTLNVMEVEVDG